MFKVVKKPDNFDQGGFKIRYHLGIKEEEEGVDAARVYSTEFVTGGAGIYVETGEFLTPTVISSFEPKVAVGAVVLLEFFLWPISHSCPSLGGVLGWRGNSVPVPGAAGSTNSLATSVDSFGGLLSILHYT